MSLQYQVPATPQVISPSPTPCERQDGSDSYFAPIARSATRRANSAIAIAEEHNPDSDFDERARTRSRSPRSTLGRRRLSGLTPVDPKPLSSSTSVSASSKQKRELTKPNGISNGHLSPFSAAWRELSRSPSPLGLIPIHRKWRSFIHSHEIPRKALHLSIGFFTLHLYTKGVQPATIHPWLLGALIPIASVDSLRHRVPSFNRLYVRALGALMRESEVNDRYNGVIWYLLGTWVAIRFFPKDIGVMSVLLLSWCDTAASTVGRLYGRYTPRIRKGKSLAGSAAAALVGAGTAWIFWGMMVPRFCGYEEVVPSNGVYKKINMFRGVLSFPQAVKNALGMTGQGQGTVGGWIALGVISVWSGLVVSASEVVDLWGIDDNLTIPVLSGVGLWGFFKCFT